jgi:hypothetical protein
MTAGAILGRILSDYKITRVAIEKRSSEREIWRLQYWIHCSPSVSMSPPRVRNMQSMARTLNSLGVPRRRTDEWLHAAGIITEPARAAMRNTPLLQDAEPALRDVLRQVLREPQETQRSVGRMLRVYIEERAAISKRSEP